MSTPTPIHHLRTREAELQADIERLRAEMLDINEAAGDKPLTAGQDRQWTDLERAIEKKQTTINEVRDKIRATLIDDIESGRRVPVPVDGDPVEFQRNYAASHGSSWKARRRLRDDDAGIGLDVGLLDRGRRTIDNSFRDGLLPDYAAERASNLIEDGMPGDRSLAARWAATAGDPHYRTAFAKMLGDPDKGHLLWSEREREAFSAVAHLQSQVRAMSTTDTEGGHMIPLTLDPALLISNSGSINPLRELATVKQTMTDSWRGITTAGATSEWKTEGSEAADGSPTLANVDIPMFTGDSFVPYSYEVGMDAMNFLEELSEVLVDSLMNLYATAYTTGNGSSAPAGIVTGLVGTSSEINGQGSEAIAATDPFDLQNALPARFSANATWQAHIATMNTYRQFETSNGAHEFPELRLNPPYLLGKRFYENSNMDGAINAAATANNYVMVYGDVRKGFFIVDRVGARLELIPNLVGANQRPTGQRGAILWARTGSKVVVPEALRLLDIPTTA